MAGLEYEFGHESVSEPVSKADSDSDMGSDMDFGLGQRKFQNIGHQIHRPWEVDVIHNEYILFRRTRCSI